MPRLSNRAGCTFIKLWMTDELLAKLTKDADDQGVARQTLITQVLAKHFQERTS